jgi:hypothetical protein
MQSGRFGSWGVVAPNTTPGYHRIVSWVRARFFSDPPAGRPHLNSARPAPVAVDESVHLVERGMSHPRAARRGRPVVICLRRIARRAPPLSGGGKGGAKARAARSASSSPSARRSSAPPLRPPPVGQDQRRVVQEPLGRARAPPTRPLGRNVYPRGDAARPERLRATNRSAAATRSVVGTSTPARRPPTAAAGSRPRPSPERSGGTSALARKPRCGVSLLELEPAGGAVTPARRPSPRLKRPADASPTMEPAPAGASRVATTTG